jgi:hypothetical protein
MMRKRIDSWPMNTEARGGWYEFHEHQGYFSGPAFAINVPYDRVRALAPGLLPDKEAEIIDAARELAALG